MTGRRKQLAISDFFKAKDKPDGNKAKTTTPEPAKGPNPLAQFSLLRLRETSTETTPPPKRPKISSSGDGSDSKLSRVGKKSNIATKITRKSSGKLTPLEQQVLELKRDHPDKMMVIQVGYKYKLFGEDARAAAKALDIMFITRDDKEGQFSYCSFPDVRLHINLKRLLVHGHKVGVVKQMELAIVNEVEKTGSEVMQRQLTGVYTQGTYLGDESEEMKTHEEHGAYIAAVYAHDGQVSFVAAHPRTGDVVHDLFVADRIEFDTRFRFLNPSETIILGDEPNVDHWLRIANPQTQIMRELPMTGDDAAQVLKTYFEQQERLELFTAYQQLSPELQQCVVALKNYLEEFKLALMLTVADNLRLFQDRLRYMVLSDATCRALDVFELTDGATKYTLFWQLNQTRTRFGQRMLYQWLKQPLIDREEIAQRHQAIEDLGKGVQAVNVLVESLNSTIGRVDLEELLMKVHYGRIKRKDVFTLLDKLNHVMETTVKFDRQINELTGTILLTSLLRCIHTLQKIAATQCTQRLIAKIRVQFKEFKEPERQATEFFNTDIDAFGGAIDTEREKISEIEDQIEDELKRVRQVLNRPQLSWLTNNKEPYLVEVRNGKDVDRLPGDFERVNGTKTVSRFRTLETNRLYKLLQYHQERLVMVCDQTYQLFLKQIDEEYGQLAEAVSALAELDCLVALREASSRFGDVCRPQMVDEQVIEVELGVHPVLSAISEPVANNTELNVDKDRVFIITGPNMGGKLSYVKQVALFAIMAQVGCWLPAKLAKMGVFDRVFLRMGASDDILRGQLTFMTEMQECAQIIDEMTPKLLIILDEIGRGTGTTDGVALALSILQYLVEDSLKPLVLFITHYPSLHTLDHFLGVKNYHMGYQQIHDTNNDDEIPEVIFLYTLEPGVANSSYGLNVAKIAGIPDDVIRQAHDKSAALQARVETARTEKLTQLMAWVTT